MKYEDKIKVAKELASMHLYEFWEEYDNEDDGYEEIIRQIEHNPFDVVVALINDYDATFNAYVDLQCKLNDYKQKFGELEDFIDNMRKTEHLRHEICATSAVKNY